MLHTMMARRTSITITQNTHSRFMAKTHSSFKASPEFIIAQQQARRASKRST